MYLCAVSQKPCPEAESLFLVINADAFSGTILTGEMSVLACFEALAVFSGRLVTDLSEGLSVSVDTLVVFSDNIVKLFVDSIFYAFWHTR